MTPTLSHEELQELLGAYALDALEPDEAEAVEDHLAGCAACRRELRGLAGVAGLLGTADAEPPAELWQRITSEISAAAPTPLRRPPTPRVTLTRRWTMIGAAAAIVLLAGLATLGVVALRQQHQLERANQALVTGSGQQNIRQAALTAAASPDARRVELTDSRGTTVATVIVLPGSPAYLVPADLHALDAARTYQLWGQHGNELISLAVLGSSPGVTAVAMPPGLQALAISTETSPGATAPSAAPIAEAALA